MTDTILAPIGIAHPDSAPGAHAAQVARHADCDVHTVRNRL